MITPIKFSFIITFRFKPDRIMPLKRTIDWISGFSGVELIIVEQDSHSKIGHLPLKGKHIFLKNAGTFNKCWGYNVGLKESTAPIVVFGDSDLVMNPNHFISALMETANYEVINPYKSVIDLNPEENNLNLDQIFQINRTGRGENDHQKVPMCGGITIFRKESILKIGGWAEMFVEWGGEDDFQSLKVKNFLTYIELPNKCYHFYHQRGVTDMNSYQRNLQILNHFNSAPKSDLEKHIAIERQKIGMINKYC